MNASTRFLILIILLFHAVINSRAQETDSLLNFLGAHYPQEKVYLHTDKQFYTAGETIWFKAYLTTDNSNVSVSKICYAELLDEKGFLLQRKIMPVLVSGAASHFILPDTLPAEKLFIRAYTAWMLNFDSSLLYFQPVNIVPSKPTPKKIVAKSIASLVLFPEGGDLVQGVSTVVAFKATDQYGTPLNISGKVMDENDTIITSFSCVHDGMGYFDIVPLEGKRYSAVWKDDHNMEHKKDLPEAKKDGIVLSTIYTTKLVQFTITRPGNQQPVPATYHIIAQMQQAVMYSATIHLSEKNSVTAYINTDSLPNGILQLTVFNESQVPVGERLVFINNHNYYFNTAISTTEKTMAKRGKNILQLEIADSLLSNLSIAVTDASVNPVTGNEENIITQLLLTSDLKGYVFNPAYYFSSDDDSVKQHLDLVMMTNGWRRFKWDDVLAERWPLLQYQPEKFISVKGRLERLSRRMLKNTSLSGILNTKNNGDEYFAIPFSDDGKFGISDLRFFDSAKLYYQLNNKKGKNLTPVARFITGSCFTASPNSPLSLLSVLHVPPAPDSLTVSKSNLLIKFQREQDEKNKMKTLNTVVVKTRVKNGKEILEAEYASAMFTGGDGVIFNIRDDPFARNYQSVLGYLQGRVGGLQIRVDPMGKASATWSGRRTSIFINDTNADSSDLVQDMSMSDVAMIKVFRPPFFGSAGGGPGGAIAVYTKKSGDISAVKGLDFVYLEGYSVVKEFYSPNYETVNDRSVKDSRVTLYWNPFILMDKTNRRINIPFYNSDNCKSIRVVVEGINELGQLTRQEKFIK